MRIFEGSGVAIITPFKDNEIDYQKFAELINWQIENKTKAIIVNGTTGESATLSKEEKVSLIKFAKDVIKERVPLIAGTGGNNTKDVIELSKIACEIGVDALLIVTPYYNKTTQKGLIRHYLTIADNVNKPIIIYNVPGRTSLNLLPDSVLTLSKHPLIVAIKEASGDISQVAKIASLVGNDFTIYSGNDDIILPVLSLGGKGVISVLANIEPKKTAEMVDYYLNNHFDEAKNIQLGLLGLINALFIEPNPIPVKEAMNLIGMNVGKTRLPLVEIDDKNRKILIDELQKAGYKIGSTI